MATYKKINKLLGYSDSVMAGARIGRSAFSVFVDFSKVGAAPATGLVVGDIVDGIGGLPSNCVVRSVAAQVVQPITVLSADGISALPMTLKAGSTSLATLALVDINGPSLGNQVTDVSLANGNTGIDGAKENLSLTIGAVLDDAGTPAATAITGGLLMLTFSVDYMPEPDELAAWFDVIDEVSDGGNTAPDSTIGSPYSQ